MWLDTMNLWLCKIINLEYIREVFGVEYRMKNYNDKAKCKIEDGGYEKIKKYRIIDLKNIILNIILLLD